MGIYDDIDADVLRNYQEFALVNIIYYGLKESTTSEQSARMTAMDSASKNACETSFLLHHHCLYLCLLNRRSVWIRCLLMPHVHRSTS